MDISKILKIVTLAISLIAVFFFWKVATINGAADGGSAEEIASLSSAVGGFTGFAKWLLIIVGLLIVAFMIWDVIKHPSKLKKTIIGVVAFLGLLAISYMFAKSGKVVTNSEVVEAGSTLSKRVSTGIIFSAILGGLAFLGFVVDSVKSLFK